MTDETFNPPPQTTEPGSAPHRKVSRGLLGTLRGFLYAAAATALGGAIATYNEIGAFDDATAGATGGFSRLLDAEEVSSGLVGLFGLAAIVVAVLTIIWWYQAYQAIERHPTSGRSWSAGWAVGGWFIPVANFIIPKLVLNEIDRTSQAAEAGSSEWRDRDLVKVAHWWWGFFILGSVLLAVGTSIASEQLQGTTAFDPDLYRTGLQLTGFGLAVDTVAALLGAAALRVIGARVSR